MPDPFTEAERRAVYRAVNERRDVRSQFLPTPVPAGVLGRILTAAHHAPSVGFMQPWDFVVIQDAATRGAMHENFLAANRRAAERYSGAQRELYGSLRLAGLADAPLHLCVTCDPERTMGAGLGRQTAPETDVYSTVCAVQNLWLAARAEGLGVGWVSILDYASLRELLGIPAQVTVVAYLCIGYVSEFQETPDLERAGWSRREPAAGHVRFERWEGRDEARAVTLLGE